jgi:hypothetical protein
MTSARKVGTNRANARASTGPKTSAGRTRSARNALRHGFNVPIADLEVFSPEVERLAEAISGTQPGDAQLVALHRDSDGLGPTVRLARAGVSDQRGPRCCEESLAAF